MSRNFEHTMHLTNGVNGDEVHISALFPLVKGIVTRDECFLKAYNN
jgi:hypothetical protein